MYAGNLADKLANPSPSPVIGIAANSGGSGYLLATAAGGVYALGGAFFMGSPL